MSQGRFITLEGGEGTGKSTLIGELCKRLEASGAPVVRTREPGGTPLAESIRSLVLHPVEGQIWSPMAEALLMNAARSDHLEKLIRPTIANGAWVLCDRFADSTRVYQSVTGGVQADVLKLMESIVVADTMPDLTIVLDVPVAVAMERRTARATDVDAFEARDLTFHQHVREAFIQLAHREKDRCILIDGAQPADKVADIAWAEIVSRFGV